MSEHTSIEVDVTATDEVADPWARTRGGLYVPAAPRRTLRAVDLFCGCGGFSLGMQQAGIDVIAAVEWWPGAAMTYLHNLGSTAGAAIGFVTEEDRRKWHKAVTKAGESATSGWIGRHNPNHDGSGCRAMIIGDAAHVTGDLIRDTLAGIGIRCDIDVVIGGPPCQGISQIGKQDIADPRNNYVLEFWRLADELGADVAIMENVPPLVINTKYRPLFDELVRRANAAGFDITANVLDAVNYGVPQFRRRALVAGTRGRMRNRRFTFPMPTHWSFGALADGTKTWEQRRSGERVPERRPRPSSPSVLQRSLF